MHELRRPFLLHPAPLTRGFAFGVAVWMCGACGEPAPAAAPASMRVDPDLRAAMENEIRRDLRVDLRRELREELRRELREEVANEVRRELGAQTAPASVADDAPKQPEASRIPPRTEVVAGMDDGEAKTGTSIATPEGPVRLLELAVATNVVDREPQDVRERYDSVPDMLYCYCSADSREANQSITHVWRRDGVLVSRVELEIGKSPRWKTWSKQKAMSHWTGLWSCEVLGPDGAHLGITRFALGQ